MPIVNFNKYIFESKDCFYNLTTKKILPKNSSVEEFRNNYFLENQELESVDHALFENQHNYFSIKVIPTWECNLRCEHCFVLHELLKKDTNEINIKQFLEFIENYVKKYPHVKECSIQFLGGEPTLKAKFNNKLIKKVKAKCKNLKINCKFNLTSNGIKLDKEILSFYENLDSFMISLDGFKESHDIQRKSIEKNNISPFEETLKTINVLCKLGMAKKMKVQASINGDEFFTENNIFNFYKILLKIGVIYENIYIGCVVPTEHNPKISNKIKEVFANGQFYSSPCCKYRFMRDFVVDSTNNIYCDYFYKKENLLGSLTDPIEKIAENHKRIIKEKMPALSDKKCMECPVIGACWGFCCNLVTINPSDYCNQSGLIEKVRDHVAKGKLK
jgi:radical SAM protein with 4Fe4S-binding SPASM domain